MIISMQTSFTVTDWNSYSYLDPVCCCVSMRTHVMYKNITVSQAVTLVYFRQQETVEQPNQSTEL